MPTAIIFDLDDTLNDRWASIQHYTGIFLARYESQLVAIERVATATAIRRADRNGYRSKSEIFAELQEQLPWREAPTVEELTSHWFDNFPGAIQPRAHAQAVLETLKREGHTLGLITNGNIAGQRKKIDRLGFRDFFSTIVISEEFGTSKPDPAIFLHAVAKLGGSVGETWFVGDHPINDIQGAASAGLKPIWLRGIHAWPVEFNPPLAQIESLDQLPPLLSLSPSVR